MVPQVFWLRCPNLRVKFFQKRKLTEQTSHRYQLYSWEEAIASVQRPGRRQPRADNSHFAWDCGSHLLFAWQGNTPRGLKFEQRSRRLHRGQGWVPQRLFDWLRTHQHLQRQESPRIYHRLLSIWIVFRENRRPKQERCVCDWVHYLQYSVLNCFQHFPEEVRSLE